MKHVVTNIPKQLMQLTSSMQKMSKFGHSWVCGGSFIKCHCNLCLFYTYIFHPCSVLNTINNINAINKDLLWCE